MPLWGKIDNEASKPKYLSDTLRNDQTISDKDATLGVDRAESQEEANRLKAIKTPGWTQYRTYVDSNGNTRHKAEILVAFGGDFEGGDNDTIPPTVIIISEQPVDQTVEDGEAATFTVDYSPVSTVEFAIQWQVSTDEGATWTDIDGEDGFDLEVTSTADEYVDGNQFRAVITAGGSTATSDVATLTITPAPEPETP